MRSEDVGSDRGDFRADIGWVDLEQFESMLSSTEQLIEDMTTMCNLRGYGLDDEGHGDAERDDLNEALTANMALFGDFAAQQLVRYDLNLSSNDIVDLMGVEPRRSVKTQRYDLTECL